MKTIEGKVLKLVVFHYIFGSCRAMLQTFVTMTKLFCSFCTLRNSMSENEDNFNSNGLPSTTDGTAAALAASALMQAEDNDDEEDDDSETTSHQRSFRRRDALLIDEEERTSIMRELNQLHNLELSGFDDLSGFNDSSLHGEWQ